MPIDGTNIICHIKELEHMVEILCPHCEGEIELDDDASGEFECPLCGGEFEWNISPEVKPSSGRNQAMEIVSHPIQWFGLAFSVIMLVILILSLSATYYTAGDEEGFLDVKFKLSEFEFDAAGSAVSFDYSDSEKVWGEGSTADKFGTWGVAGFIGKMCFILALIVCSLSIVARVLNVLYNIEVVQLPEAAENIVSWTSKFSSFIISSLILLGIILFMIISPSASTMEFNQEGLDYGFTFFTWFMLVLPILYAVFSKLEVDFS